MEVFCFYFMKRKLLVNLTLSTFCISITRHRVDFLNGSKSYQKRTEKGHIIHARKSRSLSSNVQCEHSFCLHKVISLFVQFTLNYRLYSTTQICRILKYITWLLINMGRGRVYLVKDRLL